MSSGGRARLLDVVHGVTVALYPVLLYAALRYMGVRAASGLLLLLLAPRLVRWWVDRRGRGIGPVLVQVLGVGALASLTLVFPDPRVLKQVPVLVNAFLLASFAVTLFRPPAMVERYARMVKAELSPKEQAHCRAVTAVWAGFFLVNAAVSEVLALFGTMDAWTLYCGGVAYVLVGLVFAGEYVYRVVRFGGAATAGGGVAGRLLCGLLRRGHPPGSRTAGAWEARVPSAGAEAGAAGCGPARRLAAEPEKAPGRGGGMGGEEVGRMEGRERREEGA